MKTMVPKVLVWLASYS
uniref:Uncharacterized protein n=1 Tax=Arundo donax TaxID=35708 RepID=A0A0A9AGB7_ARUDO